MTQPLQYSSLYDVDLGTSQVYRRECCSLLRAVRHADARFIVDPINEIGISVALATSYSLRYKARGRAVSVTPQLGRLAILAPGHAIDVAVQGECSILQLRLPLKTLAGWWEEDHEADGVAVELFSRHSVEDPLLARLLCNAKCAGVEAEGEILRGVAACLLQRYSKRPRPPFASARGGLTVQQLGRVVERVEDRLADPLSLEDLAAEARMSPFHFAREFKREVGRPPHRYVIERRLSRAIRHLRHSGRSVGAIADEVGFRHASHLSRHMRQVFGCSPGKMRDCILP